MALSGNFVKFGTLVVAFTALQWFAALNAQLFEAVPSSILWIAVGLLYAFVGAIAYAWFHGRRFVRFLLVIAIPALSNLVLLLLLDNPGYSGLMIMLIVPYAAAFCAGAGLTSWLLVKDGRYPP
ncbi:MAG TPA: hypothetical protein VFC18_04915 [Burkholderiales bacterium]|nr:hypothetical protein [Burkholderiales bacterium]